MATLTGGNVIKKHIFSLTAVLALLCLLFACFPEPPAPPEEEEPSRKPELKRYYTFRLSDVGEYMDDTIGIGFGSQSADVQPVSWNESRALSLDGAVASHELFEAVFYYKTSSSTTTKVARAVWEVGETPELRGVHRTDDGIDYGNLNSIAGTNDTGYAMLFVGTKADKTLLALGRLVEVDGVPDTTIIKTTSTSVTFAVSALIAGVSTSAAASSFVTNFGGTSGSAASIVPDVYIHYDWKRKFPLYMLTTSPAGNAITRGTYNFKTVTGTYFDDYKAGIVLAGGYNYEVRQPRYIITNGLYQTSSIFVQDLRQGSELAVMEQNTRPVISSSPPAAFVNPVPFRFDTSSSPNGSIFALVFEIYVYNLTSELTSDASIISEEKNRRPIRWRISPGVGTKWLDLDDGSGGEGGAILLGSGNITEWLRGAGAPGF